MDNTVLDELTRLRKRAKSEWVFVQQDDRTEQLKDIRNVFYKAIRRAGIAGFRFHDLRHTAASWMVMKGVDLYRVQRILGQKDSRMTQRYAHLSPSYLREAVKVLDELGHHMDTKKDVRSGSNGVVGIKSA